MCPFCNDREASDQLVDRSVHVFCCPDCLPHVTAAFAAYDDRPARRGPGLVA